MLTSPYQVRQELVRGRDETILLSIFGNFIVGCFALAISAAALHTVWPGLLFTFATFAYPIWRNRKKRRLSAGTLGLNAAYRAISQGRLGEAEELLATVEQFNREGWARRLTSIQRSLIALRRGDLKAARIELDESLELLDDGNFKTNTSYQIEGAHAMRAFVLAGLGDREAALADAAWVRAQPNASPEALARVTLAEAILLERAGERESLRTLLDRERTLLLEHTHPRERAIVRAFQRMLKVSTSSVYRERAPEEAPVSQDEPDLDDWVSRVAPGAAGFVRKSKRANARLNPQQAAFEAQQQQYQMQQAHQALQMTVAQSQWRQPFVAMPGGGRNTKSNSQRNWLIAGGIVGATVLVVGLVSLLSAIGPTPTVDAPTAGPDLWAWVWPLLGTGALGGVTYAFIRRAHKRRLQREQLAPARRAAQQGSATAGPSMSSTPDLAAITDGPDDVLAAQGHMMIATGAEQRGEWVLVLQECDKAIARLWSLPSQQRADILYPDLHSLRAFALACLGRYADAEAALRFLGATYPHYERACYRVRLVELLQSVGAQPAATYAEAYSLELPLSVREELLSDLARAVAAPGAAGLGEVARLRDELEKTDHARAWVSSICPRLLDAFVGQQETDISDLAYRRRAEEQQAEAEIETDLNDHPARVMFNR